jgi:hypothetical protein
MLMVLTQRSLRARLDYRVEPPLTAQSPEADKVEIPRGHYPVGAKRDPAAYDNEEPTQVVELSGFRNRSLAAARHLFAGVRLVFPPERPL